MPQYQFVDISNTLFEEKTGLTLPDLIYMACMIRRSFNIGYDIERANLPDEIKNFRLETKGYKETAQSPNPVSRADGLYQYAYYLGLDAGKSLLDPDMNMQCLIARKNSENSFPCGTILYNQNTDDDNQTYFYLHYVAVKDTHQGIGTGLLRSLILSHPEGTEFVLDVRKMNVKAIKAYEKMGFSLNQSTRFHSHYDPQMFHVMSLKSTGPMLEHLKSMMPHDAESVSNLRKF